jgi:hypothetical protein
MNATPIFLPTPWGGARAAGGGVIGIGTVAHDPSGPSGHLPNAVGEET